jgi:hypothetical protein
MKKFIYVFSGDDRDKMLGLGFALLKSDTVQEIYVFANKETQNYSNMDFSYILSDTMTF